MSKLKKQEKAPKSCQECEHWAEVRNKLRVSKVLGDVITKMESQITAKDYKPSLADFLRLVQLDQESAEEELKEIKVTWVEPVASSEI